MAEHPPEEPVLGDAPPQANTLFGNKLYDKLKWLALVFLPAAGTFYFGLDTVWNLPKDEEVVKTIMAFETFLGLLLGVSTTRYKNSPNRYAGRVLFTGQIDEDTGEPEVQLRPRQDPAAWQGKKEVTFKIDSR